MKLKEGDSYVGWISTIHQEDMEKSLVAKCHNLKASIQF